MLFSILFDQQFINPVGNKVNTLSEVDYNRYRISQQKSEYLLDNIVLQESSPIKIINNEDFLKQANENKWLGTGSEDDPITIENLVFEFNKSNPTIMISISNTNLFFKLNRIAIIYHFSTDITQNIPSGIMVTNCSNGLLTNNYFQSDIPVQLDLIKILSCSNVNISYSYFRLNNYNTALYLFNTNASFIQFNFFIDCYFSLYLLENNFDITITNNNFVANLNGIYGFSNTLGTTFHAILVTNNFFSNNGNGILFSGVNGAIDANIFISETGQNKGIYLERSLNSKITNNFFIYNDIGIVLRNNVALGEYACSSSNNIPECSEPRNNITDAIILHQMNVTIFHNEFRDQSQQAIYISNTTDGNNIYHNNFKNNNLFMGGSQIVEGREQIFSNYFTNETHGNYWSDYNGSDINQDGLGEIPYSINSISSDIFPSIEPYNISKPNFFYYEQNYFLNRLEIRILNINNLTSATCCETTSVFASPVNSDNLLKLLDSFLMPVLIGIAIVSIMMVAIAIFTQYKKNKYLEQESKSKKSFKEYLINKLAKYTKNNEIRTNNISESTFQLLEDILKENSEEKK